MKKIIITLSLLLLCSLSFSQKKQEIEKIKSQLIELSKKNRELQNKLVEEKSSNLERYNNINNYNSNSKIRLDSLEKDIEEKSKNWIISLFTFWGAFGGIVGLIISLIGVKKYIKNRTDEIAIKKIKDLTDLNTETIKRVYQTEDERKLLRDRAKVLIINEYGTDLDNSIEKIFIKGSEKSKFNSELKNIQTLNEDISFSKYDLVVLDNSRSTKKRDWVAKDILEFSDKCLTQNVAIYYFSEDIFFPTRDDNFNKLKNKHLLAYGNAHANIYNNAMNVLQLKFLFDAE